MTGPTRPALPLLVVVEASVLVGMWVRSKR
jgi:hypothetical protein